MSYDGWWNISWKCSLRGFPTNILHDGPHIDHGTPEVEYRELESAVENPTPGERRGRDQGRIVDIDDVNGIQSVVWPTAPEARSKQTETIRNLCIKHVQTGMPGGREYGSAFSCLRNLMLLEDPDHRNGAAWNARCWKTVPSNTWATLLMKRPMRWPIWRHNMTS